MIIISHDLEIVDYCNHVMVLDEGKVTAQGHPEELINQLPGNGSALLIDFEVITIPILEKISKLPHATFTVRSGRNSIKVFTSNPQKKLLSYLQLLNRNDMEPKKISIVKSGFSDLFRVKPWIPRD